MKKNNSRPRQFKSLSEALHTLGLPGPKHPLITLINGIDNSIEVKTPTQNHILNFYKISFRPRMGGTIRYGQTHFDFNEGGMLFAAPNQIIGHLKEQNSTNENQDNNLQITLLIDPDFLLNYPLSKKIKQYNYFSYAVNEALHLSDKEKEIILSVFRIIEDELDSRIDEFSQDVVVSQIDLLLNYANRFYKRQFLTRKEVNITMLQNVDEILEAYFNEQKPLEIGLPSVNYLANCLHITPGYLSDMLRSFTGLNAQQHIHNKLIEKAKLRLSNTELSVGEIAFQLGFEYPQSFSKLFKSKTNFSPKEFRQSFN
ncbi:helix-turn-helix transcriptional regulator [Cellulophaga baltica]|uniref:helix-turn-helix domain-containing protein n=1 Tax=Cellulophaga TaxID=104264 RepID=UPI001C07E501|nr:MULTISPECIES: response regulator transcription factor [Cellulophaga]MBU2998118.1 helix-turn-helix transcriptional regulator [Cellulophaga baltica]MDO6769522.1 helix-turn-helix transcriptional regulator [Cellulophaga sp. 1_MG-2023]